MSKAFSFSEPQFVHMQKRETWIRLVVLKSSLYASHEETENLDSLATHQTSDAGMWGERRPSVVFKSDVLPLLRSRLPGITELTFLHGVIPWHSVNPHHFKWGHDVVCKRFS